MELLHLTRGRADITATRPRALGVYDDGEFRTYDGGDAWQYVGIVGGASVGSRTIDDDDGELHAGESIALPGEVNVSIALKPLREPDAGTPPPRIADMPYWRPEWTDASDLLSNLTWTSASGKLFGLHVAPRIVVPAVPPDYVPACIAACRMAGRHVTYLEPCRTWRPRTHDAPSADARELCGRWWEAVMDADGRVDMDKLAECVGLQTAARSLTSSAGEPVVHASECEHAGTPVTETLRLDSLLPDDAPVCNEHWKYRNGAVTEVVLRKCIESRPSVCVRVRTCACVHGVERPVAWMLTRADATFGTLHTLAEYRGRGIAKALVHALTALHAAVPRQLRSRAHTCGDAPLWQALLARADAAELLHPYCHIAIGNEASEAVFTKLGWEPVEYVTWIVASRPAPRLALARCDVDADVASLVDMINASYREDDAFFVDMIRTSADEVRRLAAAGMFLRAYMLRVPPQGLRGHHASYGLRAVPELYADDAPLLDGVTETREMMCCVHVQRAAHDGTIAELRFLTVSSRWKRCGIAERVSRLALRIAHESLGCTSAEIDVVSVKPWLIAWYERLGFVRCGETAWVPDVGEVLKMPVHFVRMRCTLPSPVIHTASAL